jgi:hypothetical protein
VTLRALVLLAAMLVWAPAEARTLRPAPPPEHLRAGVDRPGWAVDRRTGCWIWSGGLRPREVVSWSGGCGLDGRAAGTGIVEWRAGDKVSRGEGELDAGKWNGRAIVIGYEGERYEGEWLDGVRHGRGTQRFPDGVRYEGEWRGGQPRGAGILMFPDGDRYEGQVVGSRRHGRGINTKPDGNRYEGDWRDNRKSGRGIETWPDDVRYEGDYRDDRPDGSGEATIRGERYGGRWVSGCIRDGVRRAAIGRPVEECP